MSITLSNMSSSKKSDVDLIMSVRSSTFIKITKRDEINSKKSSEEERTKFFHETIHIYLKHNDVHEKITVEGGKDDANYHGDLAKDNQEEEATEKRGQRKIKDWHIQRIRLDPEFLQQIIDRHLHSTEDSGSQIAYLRERETGQIILPQDIQRVCKAYIATSKEDKAKQLRSRSSCSYELFLSRPNKTKDVMASNLGGGAPSYQGGMKFVLHNVPLTSQNSLHSVKALHVQNWIVDGILQEDMNVRKLENEINRIMTSLESIKKQMKRVSEEPVFNDRGQEVFGKKAQKKREERYSLLQREKDMLHVQYDQALDDLLETKQKLLKTIDLSVSQLEDKATWEFTFHGECRESLDELLVKKRNWNTSFMYTDSEVDLLNGDYDYSFKPDNKYLVDSMGISIERLENGYGCYHLTKPNDPINGFRKTYQSHINAYHGTYYNGKKTGHGMVFAHDGIYGGKVEEDLPKDQNGMMICKDGDIIKGHFSPHIYAARGDKDNPYARSTPNGQCTIQFSDGAFYEGEIESGIIHGQGTYVSSNGYVSFL